jgi:hypothetical protein
MADFRVYPMTLGGDRSETNQDERGKDGTKIYDLFASLIAPPVKSGLYIQDKSHHQIITLKPAPPPSALSTNSASLEQH